MKGKDENVDMTPSVVLGKECWTPRQAAAAIRMSKNTVLNWIKKAKAGDLDFPYIGAPIGRSPAMVPIKEFLAWYGYSGQN